MEMLSLSKEYVSFYQIAKEMALEEGFSYPEYVNLSKEDKRRDEWENKFKNYRDTKLEYFTEILKNQGVNPDIKYKVNGEFQIPIEDKESIKLLIREYTSQYYKKFRKGKNPEIEDIEDLVKKAEEVINNNFKGEEVEKQLDSLYGTTEYHSRKASKEVYDRVTEMINKSINNIKIDKDKIDVKKTMESNKKLASFKSIDDILSNTKYDKLADIPKMRFLNDSDAEFLILFYEQMLTTATQRWNRLADIFSELRDEEIQDAAFEMLELSGDVENTNGLNKRYKEPAAVLKESLKILNEELTEQPKVKELTEEEIKKLGDIIKSLNPSKK